MFLSYHIRILSDSSLCLVYEVSGYGLESFCSHLIYIYGVCFEQGASSGSGNYASKIQATRLRDMIKPQSQCTIQVSSNNTARSFTNEMVVVTYIFHIVPVTSEEFLAIHATTKCRFTQYTYVR